MVLSVDACNNSNNDDRPNNICQMSGKRHQYLRTEEGGDQEENTVLERGKKVRTNNSEFDAFCARGFCSSSSNKSVFVPVVLVPDLNKDAPLGDNMNNHQHIRTEEAGGQDNTVLGRGKKVSTNNSEFEAGSSSSNKSCFVPVVLVPDLNKDAPLGDNKNNHQRYEDSDLQNQSRVIKLTLSKDSLRASRQGICLQFMRTNGLTKPGEIGLLPRNGEKITMASLRRDKNERMSLGAGWKKFVLANGIKVGDSFHMEVIWKDSTPMLRLLSTDPSSYKRQRESCSEACEEEEGVNIEPLNDNSAKKEEKSIEESEYYDSSSKNGVTLTLTLTPEDVKECQLILPCQFVNAYGINNLRKITILGKANVKWWGYGGSLDGTIAIGIGWSNFCKYNDIGIGEQYILQFISKDVDETPVFRISPMCFVV